MTVLKIKVTNEFSVVLHGTSSGKPLMLIITDEQQDQVGLVPDDVKELYKFLQEIKEEGLIELE